MPVNSFDDYPMSWRPDKSALTKPYYLAIATALEEDIRSGRLAPGVQLPPQRELADFLDLHLSTVTRAYKACEMKGLIYAVVGKGSFVSLNLVDLPAASQLGGGLIEMGNINPFPNLDSLILEAANTVLGRASVMHLLDYTKPWLNRRHLETAKLWLKRANLEADTDNMLITAGSQNALAVTLMSVFEPGDRIAVDAYTYPNFIGLAKKLHLRLIPVAGDELGMDPEQLAKTCKNYEVKGLYLMPSCANPTGITIAMERREALAAVVEEHALLLVEDETYSFLAPADALPFGALIPEHTIHISGISKSISPGLRVAFMAFPERWRGELLAGAYHLNLSTPALNNEIITELILSGDAAAIVERKIAFARERNAVYEQVLKPQSYNPTAFFQWYPLPVAVDGVRLEALARERGVSIRCAHHFGVGAVDQHYLRIATCSPESMEELRTGLEVIKELTAAASETGIDFIV